MTVRELIKALEEYPMDLPVINDLKEVMRVKLVDVAYYLNGSETDYTYSAAVELE